MAIWGFSYSLVMEQHNRYRYDTLQPLFLFATIAIRPKSLLANELVFLHSIGYSGSKQLSNTKKTLSLGVNCQRCVM